jgi:ribonuclease HII
LAVQIKRDALCWATGRAEVEEIDTLNIYHAGLLAMRRAVQGLSQNPEYLLVDARKVPEVTMPQRGIIHGDALSMSIAAASILAKTTRDALMTELDAVYPGYELAAHKGYPTPKHCRLLKELGATPIHRRSFNRVREALGLLPVQNELFPAEAQEAMAAEAASVEAAEAGIAAESVEAAEAAEAMAATREAGPSARGRTTGGEDAA